MKIRVSQIELVGDIVIRYQAAASLGTRGSLAAVKVPSAQATPLLEPMLFAGSR